MHRMILDKIGPINHCDITIDNFTILTGAQASGKSTIAKAIYFFRTVKDDILDIIIKKNSASVANQKLYKSVTKQLRNKFLQLFGSSRAMDNSLSMKYFYDKNTSIAITLKVDEKADYISPNYVDFDFSSNIKNFLSNYNDIDTTHNCSKEEISIKLNQLFCDDFETIFIPAGRSLITLLTTQLNYIFTVMDDEQKRTIDFCTQKYIERILRIRAVLSEGIAGYFDNKKKTSSAEMNRSLIKKCLSSVEKILKGKYVYVEGEERLVLESGRFVKINYTSSGQQESVWIFNILLYQLIAGIKAFIILEEPEAHLYPDAQKEISELLAMFISAGNAALITTHSPYVLGAVNNLLYAKLIEKHFGKERIENIVDSAKTLPSCEAFFVERGTIQPCIDKEAMLIKNEVIDGASSDINDTFDKLLETSNGEV